VPITNRHSTGISPSQAPQSLASVPVSSLVGSVPVLPVGWLDFDGVPSPGLVSDCLEAVHVDAVGELSELSADSFIAIFESLDVSLGLVKVGRTPDVGSECGRQASKGASKAVCLMVHGTRYIHA
jgi:hypothetical protein